MNILLIIYTFLLIFSLANKAFIATAILLILIPIYLFISKTNKTNKINYFKNKIELIINNSENADKNFLNINKEPWYIISLIPGVTTIYAKKVAQKTKIEKINSFEYFADFCHIELQHQEKAKSIISF